MLTEDVDIQGSTKALQALIDGFMLSKGTGDFIAWLYNHLHAVKLAKHVHLTSISVQTGTGYTYVELKVGDMTVQMDAQVLDAEKKWLWKKWGWKWPA